MLKGTAAKIAWSIEKDGLTEEKLRDMLEVARQEEDKHAKREICAYVRSRCMRAKGQTKDVPVNVGPDEYIENGYVKSKDRKKSGRWPRVKYEQRPVLDPAVGLDVIFEAYCISGSVWFDDYMSAMEFYREPQARFWWPRRKVLEGKHRIATQIQEFIDDPDALYLGFSMPPGCGKALADDTPILTRNGWKNHGDLVVGDEVIGMNGEFKKVIAVHQKCMLDRLVEFTNGEKIQCHARHEWLFYDRARGAEHLEETQVWEKRSLETGIPGKRGHRYILQLPHRDPVVGEYKNLPLDPYTFGVWLGDGANRNPRISNALPDKAIIDKIVCNGIPVRWKTVHKTTGVNYYDFDIRAELQSLGMCYSRHIVAKRIPDEYLTASLEQRLELLAGLIDTDGCRIGNKYRFSTAEESLRDSFMDLIATFGWRSYCTTVKPTMSSSGVVGKRNIYIVGFTPSIDIPCVLDRKRTKNHGIQKAIGVVGITKVEPKQGNCITVEGDGMYLAGRTMVPTHNTTLIKFLLAYIAGIDPQSANMYVSYSDGMVKMVYDSVLAMLTDEFEYRHGKVFNVGVPEKSAEFKTISYRADGDFPTIGMVSLGGSVTGRTRANRFLVTDDLVKNKEEARSPERLQKLFDDYSSTLTTRMIGDHVKQIQLGTIWSYYDPISTMKRLHGDDPRYRFIAIPVRDEETGESNFEYEHPDRYTKERIAELEKTLDSVDFQCLYMQNGIQKEGLAFPEGSLQFYNGQLPPGKPDRICFTADVAFGGGDALSVPFAYVYGEDAYIPDVIFNRGSKDITEPIVVARIMKHGAQTGRFEANNGGDFYADDVSKMLKEAKYHCNVTSKRAPTNMSKNARIEQYAPDIRRMYFLQRSLQSKEYKAFMDEVSMFSFTSKNLHDDAPDSLAMLAEYLFEKTKMVTVPAYRFRL